MPARIASDGDLGTCPIGQGSLPGQGVTGARERHLSLARQAPVPFGRKVFDMTEDTLTMEEDLEDLVESDVLLVEEISIDGMCGVY
jgi:mycofactocin precursor